MKIRERSKVEPAPLPPSKVMYCKYVYCLYNSIDVCSGNATANLFQGTIELEPKLYCSATGAGTIAVSFAIQYRANSGNPWGYINSLAGAGLDTYSATSPVVQMTKSTVNTTPVTKKYKFDQLGEYRLVTNGLTHQ